MWGGSPLVGRADEMRLLADLFAGASAAGVVLSGHPGVGKTRLAGEFLDDMSSQGVATEWVTATSAVADIPLGVMAPLLSLPSAPVSGTAELLAWAMEELRWRAPDGRLVLGVDDAHLLDGCSAAVVHRAVATGVAFVVATVRTGSPCPDPVTSLWKDELAVRVEVQPLSESETGELLAGLLGGHVDAHTRYWLWDTSEGNPLFLRELVQHGLGRGGFVETDGVWSWRGSIGSGGRLQELLRYRLPAADTAEQELLGIVTVGEPLEAELLAGVAGAGVVEACERQQLIVVETTGRRLLVRLAHPIIGEVVRDGVGALARRAICTRLADALEATGARRRGDLLRLATWRLDGGTTAGTGADVLVAAARQAVTLCDQTLAERLARAAVDAGASHEAFIGLGEALFWQGRFEEADRAFTEAAAPDADEAVRVMASIGRASTAFHGYGRVEDADALLDPERFGVRDHQGRAELQAHRAYLAVMRGQTVAGLELAGSVLQDPEAGDRARARALGPAAMAWSANGKPETAVEATAGLELAARVADELPTVAGELVAGHCVGLYVSGRLRELRELVDGLYRDSVTKKLDDYRGVWSFLLGWTELAQGRLPQARHQLREATAELRRRDVGGIRSWCHAVEAQAAAMLGDCDAARAALEEARACAGALKIWDVEPIIAAVWTAACAGELSSAQATAVAGADLLAEREQAAVELMLLHHAARVGAAGEVAKRCAVLAAGVEGALAAAVATHVTALARDDGAALDDAADRFEAIDALLLAAESAAGAAGAHRRAGLATRSLLSATRARALAETCGHPRTPALVELGHGIALDVLTPREREVAELAARGLSKRDIATRLYLSIRTVGNHLNHVYGKLGLETRDDLARLFDPD